MIYAFEDFELDTGLYELRRKGEPRSIEPQVFDVLLYLIEHRDRIVSKDDLFGKVWEGRVVSDSALTSRLKAARAAIGDKGREQRLIKTVHGRGFRFVGSVSERLDGDASPASLTEAAQLPSRKAPGAAPVGRQQQLDELWADLDEAGAGRRQIVFVTGEAGYGKTTLVQSFLEVVRQNDIFRVAHGQCLEHHGAGEPYMPVLEALGRLCRHDEDGQVTRSLSAHAPTWVAQIPSVTGEHDVEGRLRGGTQDRMLREMVEAIEALTNDKPLLIVLEDVHWSDPSTIDLITWLALRTDSTRLMVVLTFRPADLKAGDQSLYSAIQTLVVRERAREIALCNLDEPALAEYVKTRFNDATFPPEVVDALYRRTGGNPLFMRNVVEHWVTNGLVVEGDEGWRLEADRGSLVAGVPPNLRQFIEQFVVELDPVDRSLLEAASVRGAEFSTAELAVVTGRPGDEVESRCTALARQGRWVHAAEVTDWPDGTVSSRYGFNHDLYQEVLYEAIPPAGRARMHAVVGDRLEAGYGNKAADNAAELANQFVCGRVYPKAVKYLRLAASQALQRVAPREAVEYITAAIGLLERLPNDTDRARQELVLQIMLAPPLIALEGVGSEGAEAAFSRARVLCDELQEQSKLQQVLYGMGAMYEVRGEYRMSEQLMRERMDLPVSDRADLLRVETHELLACSLFHQGEFDHALAEAEKGIHQFDSQYHSAIAPAFGENPGISCRFWAALSLWFKGHTEKALEQMNAGVELSRQPDQNYALATAYIQAATLHQLMGDPEAVSRLAALAAESARQRGYVLRLATARLLDGWAAAVSGRIEEGIAGLTEGIEEARRIGAGMDRPYFLGLLAEGFGAASNYEGGLCAIDKALNSLEGRTRFFYGAELYRLRGTLLAASNPSANLDEAEQAYRKAIELARSQSAIAMELRSAVSLTELWSSQEKQDDAVELLGGIVDRFDEGADSTDLQNARDLLGTLQ